MSSKHISTTAKLLLVLEAAGVPEPEKGSWIREKGLHSEHLKLWQQEIRDTVTDTHKQDNAELRQAKKRIKELEKDLNYKEKALAEMGALLVLKKKLHQILEENKDD